MSKTIVIAGAGPGLGMGISRKFGKQGYQIALIARNADRLAELVTTLESEGITAKAFAGDLCNDDVMTSVFSNIFDEFGNIDVLFCNAVSPPAHPSLLTAEATTPEMVQMQFEARVVSIVRAVNNVLPKMVERGSGAIIMTTGLSSHVTVPFITPVSMTLAAIRKYALGLHDEMADKGVYVANVALGVVVSPDDPVSSPEKLADAYYQLVQTRKEGDVVFGSTEVTPEGLAKLKAWLDQQVAAAGK